jgi:putative addiction module component (TIGR02574 family)
MTRTDVEKLLALPAAERQDLAALLWQSLENEPLVTDEERVLIEERLEEVKRDGASPWEEARERLRARL